MLCEDENFNLGGVQYKSIFDPENMAGANYSLTPMAFRNSARVEYRIPSEGSLWLASSADALGSQKPAVQTMATKALKYLCDGSLKHPFPSFCKEKIRLS